MQTGSASWAPVIWAIPLGLLITGILHGNNWRDIEGDRALGFRTVASLLGDRGSLRYYHALVMLPFVVTAAFVALPRLGFGAPALPLSCLLVFLAAPLALRLLKLASRRGAAAGLDGETAKLNLVFGGLYTLGVLAGLA